MSPVQRVGRLVTVLIACVALGGCGSSCEVGNDEGASGAASVGPFVSLLGHPLLPSELSPEFSEKQEGLLEQARRDLASDPDDPDARIWVGRRLGYLGRYSEAIAMYTEGLEQHPDHHKLLRHRGHRRITTRNLVAAVQDLSRAAELIAALPDEIEPDGLPNARNTPTSTSHSNIWYHLGLAHYLNGNFEKATAAYRECMRFSTNPDMLVATSHWLYMTLRRLQRDEEADALLGPIHAEMDIIENDDYHRLLMMYKGEVDAEELLEAARSTDGALSLPTIGYGIGNWHLVHGRTEESERIFQQVLLAPQWAAFGYIAAEAELARDLPANAPEPHP